MEEARVKMPPGTRVRFWPGAREGEGYKGVIAAPFDILHSHTVLGWVTRDSDLRLFCVALSHIEKI